MIRYTGDRVEIVPDPPRRSRPPAGPRECGEIDAFAAVVGEPRRRQPVPWARRRRDGAIELVDVEDEGRET